MIFRLNSLISLGSCHHLTSVIQGGSESCFIWKKASRDALVKCRLYIMLNADIRHFLSYPSQRNPITMLQENFSNSNKRVEWLRSRNTEPRTESLGFNSSSSYRSIVKPWSKSKPLSQQAPKSNKSPPKNKKRRIWTLG